MVQNPGDSQGESIELLTGGSAVVGQYLDELSVTDPFTRGMIHGAVAKRADAQGIDLSDESTDVAKVNAFFIEGLTELLHTQSRFQRSAFFVNGLPLYYPLQTYFRGNESVYLGRLIDLEDPNLPSDQIIEPGFTPTSIAFVKTEDGYTRIGQNDWQQFWMRGGTYGNNS